MKLVVGVLSVVFVFLLYFIKHAVVNVYTIHKKHKKQRDNYCVVLTGTVCTITKYFNTLVSAHKYVMNDIIDRHDSLSTVNPMRMLLKDALIRQSVFDDDLPFTNYIPMHNKPDQKYLQYEIKNIKEIN